MSTVRGRPLLGPVLLVLMVLACLAAPLPACAGGAPARLPAVTAAAPVLADAGSQTAGCTAEHPCQHPAREAGGCADAASRGPAVPRADVVPAPRPVPEIPSPLPAGIGTPVPVPLPAVREPVAVLCVDRN